jgi:hypothetical protein
MAPTAEVVRKRLQNLVAEALETPGAASKHMKGPIVLNKRSLNIKFNRKLTVKEKARLVRRLKKHLETGKTKVKVRFTGKIKIGINNNTRLVLNPLTGRRVARGGARYKQLLRKGYRDVRGILVPPEVRENKRDESSFIKQFAPQETEVEVTPAPTNARNDNRAPAPTAPTVPTNTRNNNRTPTPMAPTVPTNNTRNISTPTPLPVTVHVNNKGEVVNAGVPSAVPVTYYAPSGARVAANTPGAVPVVFTNSRGDFVKPGTPGAVPVRMTDTPSLKGAVAPLKKAVVMAGKGTGALARAVGRAGSGGVRAVGQYMNKRRAVGFNKGVASMIEKTKKQVVNNARTS